ncbi:hypothetical protein ACF1G5_24765 [Streptomyces coeruleorubidus]|uniref:hypothetical protein n=1 Tax=Streptomyces coeruleorubidus TaxID=116188 RepID=UPI0036FFE8AC
MFQLGFTIGDLRHEVVVLGLALLVFVPVGVAEMSGAVQSIPWGCGWIGLRAGAVSGDDRPACVAEAPAGLLVNTCTMRVGGGRMGMQARRIDVWLGDPSDGVPQGMPTPFEIRTCGECSRVRAWVWHSYAEVRKRIKCPCGHKRNTPQKQQMLFNDRLEVLLPTIPLKDMVLMNQGYSAVGRVPRTDRWHFYSLGSFPLGDETPTWVYLIAFPDWNGERFVKIGIGLDQRVRDHETRGGLVLQKVQVPRWQARVIERLVLRQYPRQRPRVPLPQFGDTECLVWEAAEKIQLTALVRMTAGIKSDTA